MLGQWGHHFGGCGSQVDGGGLSWRVELAGATVKKAVTRREMSKMCAEIHEKIDWIR